MMINPARFIKRPVLRSICFYCVALSVILFLNTALSFDHYNRYFGIYTSLADYCILNKEYFSFSLLILPCFLLVEFLSLKDDFNIQFILRRKTRQRNWCSQVLWIFVLAVFSAFIFVGMTLFIGSFFTGALINWNEKQSCYFLITNSLAYYSIFDIVIGLFSSVLIHFLLAGTLFNFLIWLFNKSIIAWLLILAITIFDNVFSTLEFHFTSFSIDFSRWSEPYLWHILIPIAIYLAVVVIGLIYSKNREFYHEE